MDFSTRLKEIREKNGMKQDDLAEMLQITRQAVGNYEQGSRFPNDIKLLTKIADIFDVSLDYLIGRIDTDIKASCVGYSDKIVVNHINEKKENYYTDKTMALRKLLMSVDDLSQETIEKISQVIEMLKDSLDK